MMKSGPETCRHPEGKKTTEKGEIKNLQNYKLKSTIKK
jgi:hypothetical protein